MWVDCNGCIYSLTEEYYIIKILCHSVDHFSLKKHINATLSEYSEINERCDTFNDYKLVSGVASDVLSRNNLSFKKENGTYMKHKTH